MSKRQANDGFLSAEALGITRGDKKALVKVLVGLEGGLFVLDNTENTDKTPGLPFNMNQWNNKAQNPNATCDTVHCIGGWAEAFKGKSLSEKTTKVAHELFYPYKWNIRDWDYIPVSRAAKSLRSFLTTGKEDWS